MSESITFNTYILGKLAGELTFVNDDESRSNYITFHYLDKYISDKASIPLSVRLPVEDRHFTDRELFIFLQNLFPEGSIKEKINNILKINSDDDIQVLVEVMGADIAGAIEFHPKGDPRPQPDTARPVKELNEEEISSLINNITTTPFNIDRTAGRQTRMSLAGAQPKVPISAKFDEHGNITVYRSTLSLPTNYIVKPPRDDNKYPGLVFNEYLSMKAAQASGIDTPEVRLLDFKRDGIEETAFLIKRYDRAPNTESDPENSTNILNVVKVHQEDLCQALGHSPNQKYQYNSDGHEVGGGIKDLFETLDKLCQIPARAKLECLNRVLFNFIIGNDDAHTKNFSFLHTGKRLTLSPVYDIVCTQAYDLEHTMAMAIGSARESHSLDGADIEQLELDTAIRLAPMSKSMISFIEKSVKNIERIGFQLIEDEIILQSEQDVIENMIGIARKNSETLKTALLNFTASGKN